MCDVAVEAMMVTTELDSNAHKSQAKRGIRHDSHIES